VWFLPPIATLVMALLAAGLVPESASIAAALGARSARSRGRGAAACAAAGGGMCPLKSS
jgi:hypothetical protein